MFERYTERARRTIFFARYEAATSGSDHIEPHHLLLGLLRDNRDLARRFLKSGMEVEEIRKQLEERFPSAKPQSVSVDLPLSHASKRILAYAAEESESLRHKTIGPEHLLLGMLREEKSAAAEILRERGLAYPEVRETVARRPEPPAPEPPPAPAKSDVRFTQGDLHRLVDELPEHRWDLAGGLLSALRQLSVSISVSSLGSREYTITSQGLTTRFTEAARRVLFFGRFEASKAGSPEVEPEHLLLGLIREDKALVRRFLGPITVEEEIRKKVSERSPNREAISAIWDLPLSDLSQRVLKLAGEESEQLGHAQVGTEHYLLGFLREESCLAAEILKEHGLELGKLREQITGGK